MVDYKRILRLRFCYAGLAACVLLPGQEDSWLRRVGAQVDVRRVM
jgi:hypothetical protein